MERYTKRLSNGVASWNYQSDCYGEDETRNKIFSSVHRQNACEKLAAYEDTGLEPEEFKQAFAEGAIMRLASQSLGVTPDRLRDLAQADREGRVKIEQKARRCPRCGKMTLYPRIDWQYYYCYSCKTQFTKEEVEETLRREWDNG